MLYLGRTLIGLTQAPLIVYMPVCRHIDSVITRVTRAKRSPS
jgi:hypothetical protein